MKFTIDNTMNIILNDCILFNNCIDNTGAIAVPINNIKVLIDKKKPLSLVVSRPICDITEGITKEIPAIKITLNNVIIIRLCVTPISINEIPAVINEIRIMRFTPMKSLMRPADNANNIPIKPNSFTDDIVVKSALIGSDVKYSFSRAYIETNDVKIVNETKKHNTMPLLSKICLMFLKNTENFVSGI